MNENSFDKFEDKKEIAQSLNSFGFWNYSEQKKTISYQGKNQLGYDIDLKRSCVLRWVDNLSNKEWLEEKDVKDLICLFDIVKLREPNLPVFTNKVPQYLKKKYDL